MGMAKKLEEARKRGFEEGVADAMANFEKTNFVQTQFLKGYWQGAQETFELVQEAAALVPGIGPKTQERLRAAMRKKANEVSKSRGVNFNKIGGGQ